MKPFSRPGLLWTRWVDLLSEREPGTSLALFRIACGVCVLLVVGDVAVSGMVPVLWLNPADGGYRPVSTPWLLEQIGGVTPGNVWLLVGVALAAGALLIVGILGWLAALAALQTVFALTSIDRPGFDDLILCNALWLLFLSRSTATLSLACRLRTGRWVSGELVPSWPRYLVVFQMVLFYWAAGMHKVSVYWTPADGYSALYYILQRPGWVRWDMPWLARVYPLTQAATAMTWWWEVTSPLLLLVLWYRRTGDRPGRIRKLCNRLPLRGAFVAVGVAMHLGILVFMVLGPFAWIVWTYYICLFRPGDWQRWLRLPKADAAIASLPSRTLWQHCLGILIALHIFAVTLLALPAPMYADRESWRQPRVRPELAAWATYLTDWGWAITPEELEDRLWQISDRYLRIRGRLVAPFGPYYRYCGTLQGWRMFVAPDMEPCRLEIDVREGGEWRTVYRELDPEQRWLDGKLDFWRLRVALFSTEWSQNWVEFRSFAVWVAGQADRNFPRADRVRIRLFQYRLLPPAEAREGRKPEERLVQDVEVPVGR